MRCALAITVRVNVADGTDGSTDPSIRWMFGTPYTAQQIRVLAVRKRRAEVVALTGSGQPHHRKHRKEIEFGPNLGQLGQHRSKHGRVPIRDDSHVDVRQCLGTLGPEFDTHLGDSHDGRYPRAAVTRPRTLPVIRGDSQPGRAAATAGL